MERLFFISERKSEWYVAGISCVLRSVCPCKHKIQSCLVSDALWMFYSKWGSFWCVTSYYFFVVHCVYLFSFVWVNGHLEQSEQIPCTKYENSMVNAAEGQRPREISHWVCCLFQAAQHWEKYVVILRNKALEQKLQWHILESGMPNC